MGLNATSGNREALIGAARQDINHFVAMLNRYPDSPRRQTWIEHIEKLKQEIDGVIRQGADVTKG